MLISFRRASRGSRYSGIPTAIMSPGTGSFSNTVTKYPFDVSTWGQPDAEEIMPIPFKSGRNATAKIEAWHDPVMRGEKDIPMHHEENWWNINVLSYAQLYLIAPLANRFPRPWEVYSPAFKNNAETILFSPATVMRDAGRILSEIDSPSNPPKQRGVAPGRLHSGIQKKRNETHVIIKGKSSRSSLPP